MHEKIQTLEDSVSQILELYMHTLVEEMDEPKKNRSVYLTLAWVNYETTKVCI